MSSNRQIEIKFEDPNPQKWCHPLKEDALTSFMTKPENSSLSSSVYKTGSLFSPLLFGKFFDPSDAFPLWEFESDVLLPNPNASSHRGVDWYQTDADYVLRAEIPGLGQNTIQVSMENGKILEISGQWKQSRKEIRTTTTKDWKSGKWWEYGYVRRLELPGQVDWRKSEAHLKNDALLEIRIPKICSPADSDSTQGI